MYPDNRYGTPAPQPQRSGRKNKGKYDVDPIDEAAGERYRALDDEVMRLQRAKAIEEPGVLAGFSRVSGLPKLSGGLGIAKRDTRMHPWFADWMAAGFTVPFEKAVSSQTCGRGAPARKDGNPPSTR